MWGFGRGRGLVGGSGWCGVWGCKQIKEGNIVKCT